MRANPVFTALLRNRLPVRRSGIFIAVLAVLFIASSFNEPSDPDSRAKQVNLIIRQIGHRLLLQAGDSTSRVLPVTEVKEGTFVLKFENELVFSHDSLMMLSQALLPKTKYPAGYMVTVNDCIKSGIVYGFQFNNTSPDILACSGRRQPKGCYTIEFSFLDFYDNGENKKPDIDQQTKNHKARVVVPVEVYPKVAALNKTTSIKGVDNQNKNLEPGEDISQGVAPNTEQLKTRAFDYSLIGIVAGGILLLLSAGLLVVRYSKKSETMPVQHEGHSTTNDSAPEYEPLGKFLFDVKDQRLLLASEVISLTDKECRVLEMLHKNFGELIHRDTLIQKIWLDEGVITGRSLDMFVSKLRRKLSADPELKITNVHGKGYKLEILKTQV